MIKNKYFISTVFGAIIVPILVFAQSEETEELEIIDSGSCGNTCAWSLDSNQKLTIWGTGENGAGNISYNGWSNYRSSVTEIDVIDGITSISLGALSRHDNVEKLTLGNTIESIGREGAYNLYNLREIIIPDSVKTIGAWAFALPYGAGFKKIVLGKNLEEIQEGAFNGCGGVSELIIPDSVKTIGGWAFYNIRISNLDIPDSVESIGDGAFKDAINLTDLTLGKNLKTIGEQAFSGASKLKELIIPESVTSIAANAFQNSGIEKLYCKIGEQADMCRTAAPNAEVFEYTFKDGYYYDKDGKCYASLQNLSIGKDIKRIYTVEEASAVTKPLGNTFRIRYR